MKRTSLFLALLLSAPAAWSHDDHECNLRSDYDLTVYDDRLLFESERNGPTIALAAGVVTIDGQRLVLEAADAERVRRFESGVRALVPEVKAIAVDAVRLASEAIKAVSVGLSSDADAVARIGERADRLQVELEQQIRAARSTRELEDDAIETAMEDLLEEVIPELVGSITAAAMKAAFSGDMAAVEAIEQRAEELERTIEREVEQRAEQIEVRADALCERARELDAIEADYQFRLPDGERLDLVETDRHGRQTAAL